MTIFLGDAISIMGSIESNYYDAIITSPPYNIGVKGYPDKIAVDEYNNFTEKWIAESLRLAPVIVVNFGAPTSSAINLGRFIVYADKVGSIQSHIVWVKSITIGDKSIGHFKPVNSNRYLNNQHESIFIISRNGNHHIDRLSVGVPYADKSNIARFRDKGDIRCRGNVLFMPYKTRNAKKIHPATYPVELAEYMIKISGAKSRILDPFVGSGTTVEAGDNLGIACDGIDIIDWGGN